MPELRVVRNRFPFTWASQAAQYPPSGPAGLSYYRGEVASINGLTSYVDCLLWRDVNGTLVGILNHYPVDFPPYEQAGNVTVMVRRDHRQRGIGTALLREAVRRWRINLYAQLYTREGVMLALAVLAALAAE